MGRVSKRGSSVRKAEGQQAEPYHEGKRYRAGIYARLSSEHGCKSFGQTAGNKAKDPQSESLEVQIEIARKFAEEFNQRNTGEVIDVIECYTDLGKTGSDFERQGFLRLMQDIRLGEIDCVIVKDLSRFGRNYLEAGNYIEKIFPFLGVRFIAVTDGLDTGRECSENKQMASEIKNLVNDMYAKDFSQRAKIQLQQRREEGSYVGGPPPYGYTAEWNGRRRVLIPDKDTRAIVRFIYEKFAETESYAAVAQELNRRHINPPYLYKKTGNVYSAQTDCPREAKGWNKSAVERILKSETYAGALVQGKTSITARNEKSRMKRPEEDRVITKDAHEPLVDRELYRRSVELRQKIQRKPALHKHPAKRCLAAENILGGIVYCGVCGRKMTGSSYMKHKAMVCPGSNGILKDELLDILQALLCMEFEIFLDKPKRYMDYGKEGIAETVKKAEADLRRAEGKIRCFYEEESRTYMDYRAGKISQKEYVSLKMQQKDRLTELRKRCEEQRKKIRELEKQELTRKMAETFISRLYVYPEKRIEIVFTFTADYMGR